MGREGGIWGGIGFREGESGREGCGYGIELDVALAFFAARRLCMLGL